jgi:hypothetical protein
MHHLVPLLQVIGTSSEAKSIYKEVPDPGLFEDERYTIDGVDRGKRNDSL